MGRARQNPAAVQTASFDSVFARARSGRRRLDSNDEAERFRVWEQDFNGKVIEKHETERSLVGLTRTHPDAQQFGQSSLEQFFLFSQPPDDRGNATLEIVLRTDQVAFHADHLGHRVREDKQRHLPRGITAPDAKELQSILGKVLDGQDASFAGTLTWPEDPDNPDEWVTTLTHTGENQVTWTTDCPKYTKKALTLPFTLDSLDAVAGHLRNLQFMRKQHAR